MPYVVRRYAILAQTIAEQTRANLTSAIRDLKQARTATATAVNKQRNFRIKKEPQTTDYVYVLDI